MRIGKFSMWVADTGKAQVKFYPPDDLDRDYFLQIWRFVFQYWT